jgi:nucleoside-diphosphate-sugar epimerase
VVPEGAVIVNLAAEHRDDVVPRSLYDDVNVQGARNLCTVAREKQVQLIVFTSSVAVYGFAPLGTDESGTINPFNDYGRTKYEAEEVLRAWQEEAPGTRTLVIVRPTVVFGEDNRGNVYNLLRQIAIGRFVMIGDGMNRKSMAYVENVAAFLQHSLTAPPGVHVFNYVDKPDFTMNELVARVSNLLGRPNASRVRLPVAAGLLIGSCFDAVAKAFGRKFPISAVRVRKFCANSVYGSAVSNVGFTPPVSMDQALERTVRHEFLAPATGGQLFFSE